MSQTRSDADNSAGSRFSAHFRLLLTVVPAVVGVGLTLASAGMELIDFEPRSEMWVGTAAGAVFLSAVPFVHGDEDQVLTGRARLLVGAGSATLIVVMGLWRDTGKTHPAVLLLLVPAVLLFITAVIALREAGHMSHARRVSQLRARFQGEESERRRWAQELHDQTLQDLAAIELRLASLAASRDVEALAWGVQDTRVLVREQIRTLRHLITQMRPLALDTLGLTAALQDLARRAEDTDTALVNCDLSALPAGIPAEMQVAIYRIVQEALNNALNHSACQKITISAHSHNGVLEITVLDDGIGVAASGLSAGARHPGFGRIGMRERALAMNARLKWSVPTGGGTLVTLRAVVKE